MSAARPDRWPTRKLVTGATVSAAVTEIWGRAMAGIEAVSTTPWIDATAHALAGSSASILVGALVAGCVGWWVRDHG